jgi:succinate dehydrogenase / fumarate reductase iron-sulfur subunit
MKVQLRVWRQKDEKDSGRFVDYTLDGVLESMSFLEMMDLLNEDLTKKGQAPVEFDSDCREGICGSCSCIINGQPHGPNRGATTCQVYMRSFNDGETITVEPWRAASFPVVRDLVVDRSAFDRIIRAGGYISAKVGPHPDANAILVEKDRADRAFDYATCIGCGACVAACPNASASLFTAAKLSHLVMMPQGQVERTRRALKMTEAMDREGFGHCTNIGECEAACPKGISIETIAILKREYAKALLKGERPAVGGG